MGVLMDSCRQFLCRALSVPVHRDRDAGGGRVRGRVGGEGNLTVCCHHSLLWYMYIHGYQ